jgi:hypothetical protein
MLNATAQRLGDSTVLRCQGRIVIGMPTRSCATLRTDPLSASQLWLGSRGRFAFANCRATITPQSAMLTRGCEYPNCTTTPIEIGLTHCR